MIQDSLHFTCVQRAPSFRIQKQLLQTTLAAARLHRLCAAVAGLPQSKSLIFGQQVGQWFEESTQKLVQEQNCLGSSL